MPNGDQSLILTCFLVVSSVCSKTPLTILAALCDEDNLLHGHLEQFSCDNTVNVTGYLCELPIQDYCLNGGSYMCDHTRTSGGYRCLCQPGYSGARCDIGLFMLNIPHLNIKQ